MARLILVRHGISAWNKIGIWTGLTDVDLALEGVAEGEAAGRALQGADIRWVYLSPLKRTVQTFAAMQTTMHAAGFTVVTTPAFNERDYGIYTGKNKWQVRDEVGEEMFQRIRRGWDVPIPEGESLKDVYARAVPYYEREVLPHLKAGETTLLVGHGNTFRALIKHLEGLSDEAIESLEVGTGEIHLYDIAPDGSVRGKEVRARNANAGKI